MEYVSVDLLLKSLPQVLQTKSPHPNGTINTHHNHSYYVTTVTTTATTINTTTIATYRHYSNRVKIMFQISNPQQHNTCCSAIDPSTSIQSWLSAWSCYHYPMLSST